MSHKDVQLLLPWYVNGTLKEDQKNAVEAELATCHECAAEVDALKALQGAVIDTNEAFPEPSPFLLSRALSRVEEVERDKEAERVFLRGWWRRQVPVAASILLAVPLVFVAAFAAVIVAKSVQTATPVAETQVGQPMSISLDRAKVASETVATAREASTAYSASNLQAQTAGAVAPAPAAKPVQVMKHGDVSLLVADVEPAIQSLYRIASRAGGDVAKLQDQTPDQPGSRHTAAIELRVPATRFDSSMEAVAGVGRVVTRSSQAEDVTDQIVDMQARLRNLRHTEADLLRIMDRSGKIADVLDVETQLSSVREQIEQLDAQLKSTQARVAYSTIDVSLADEAAASTTEPSFGSRVAGAWKLAVASVKNFSFRIVAAALWLVAFGPYLLIAVLLAIAAWVTIRRRLRATA